MPKLPKPFSRPSVNLTPSKREWQTVPWISILVDDIVPDWGNCSVRRTNGDFITLEFAGGKSTMLRVDDTSTVFAFVKTSG